MPGAGPDPHGSAPDFSGTGGTDGDMRHEMDTRSQPRQARLRLPAYHRSPAPSAGVGFSPESAHRASGCRCRPDAVGMRRAPLALAALLVLGVPGVPATAGPAPAAVARDVVAPAAGAPDAAAPDAVAPAARAPASPGWVWPVDGPRVVVRPYLAPATPYAAGHRGVDLAAVAVGDEVRAVTSGIVHFAGVVVDRPVITVRTGQVLATVEPVTPLVTTGERVEAGQVIGVLEPGHCARPCVHLGVRVAGEYVSPLRFLGGLQRAVLLPLG